MNPTTTNAPRTPIPVLWTGGWDSSFRVLELALVRRCPVQPWYFVHEARWTTPYEEAAMQAIRDGLAARDPEAAARILPTHRVPVADVPSDPERDRWREALHIGEQYAWISRYAAHAGVEAFELGLVGEGKIHQILGDDLEPWTHPCAGPSFRLAPHVSRLEHELFRGCTFPLLRLTKEGMRQEAEAAGFYDLLLRTWFCHKSRDGRPCGRCAPCEVAIQEGFGWRVPLDRRIQRRGRLLRRAVRAALVRALPAPVERRLRQRFGNPAGADAPPAPIHP